MNRRNLLAADTADVVLPGVGQAIPVKAAGEGETPAVYQARHAAIAARRVALLHDLAVGGPTASRLPQMEASTRGLSCPV